MAGTESKRSEAVRPSHGRVTATPLPRRAGVGYNRFMVDEPIFEQPPDDPVGAAVALICLRARRRDFSLAEVAKHVLYSERQLQRLLDARGISFRQEICRHRCDHAVRQLLAGWQVKKVTLNCGYRPGQLTVPFRERFGVTPTEARRIGSLHRMLTMLRDEPPPLIDVAAACRAVDRWTKLWHEVLRFRRRDLPDSPVSVLLQEAAACKPMPRPRPIPRGGRPRRGISEPAPPERRARTQPQSIR